MKRKIAIASSGLGHVWRGIEGWAIETARCLKDVGHDVTLFAAAPLSFSSDRNGSAGEPRVQVVNCLRRDDPSMARWLRILPGFSWRWGLQSPYGVEQATFWIRLWPALRNGRFDVLHVQDPMLAYWCTKFNTWGLLNLKVILAHGTNEDTEFLAGLDCVQSLTPWQDQKMMSDLGTLSQTGKSSRHAVCLKHHYVIPNFVDCRAFRPVTGEMSGNDCVPLDPAIPSDAWVVGCVAMVTRDTKRIDYLIDEFAQAIRLDGSPSEFAKRAHLVIVGARRPDTDEMMKLAKEQAPGRVHFKIDVPRSSMPDLYRQFDVLVLTSLFEMMPMAVLEGMASGLPIIAHWHQILQWVLGAEGNMPRGQEIHSTCGVCVDMSAHGALAAVFRGVTMDWMAGTGRGALNRVRTQFSESVVIQQMEAMYDAVCVEQGTHRSTS